MSPAGSLDRLPPHDEVAETALLGCVLLDPKTLVPARERFGSEDPFYVTGNQVVWRCLCALGDEGKAIDTITVYSRLKETGRIEEAGGLERVSGLPDAAPSAANVGEYIGIVWEKYLARKVVRLGTEWAGRMFENEGQVSESMLGEMGRQVAELQVAGAKYLGANPRNLSEPAAFEGPYFDCWFKRRQETYGWELPFPFPLRVRPSELTLMTGDNGSGKSSMLCQMAVVLGKQGVRTCIASMEVPAEVTLWIMARQLLGRNTLTEDDAGRTAAARALGWLQERVRLYSFLGITDWRELLDTFAYARAQLGFEAFIVDSVMRIGIPDDDYALQGLVAARFADFCVKTGAHAFLVIHENKGDGKGKDRVRGSKQWVDNAHNVVGMARNEQKEARREEWKEQLRCGEIEQAEYEEKVGKAKGQWDGKFVLSKQRWPGSQQNASKHLWFDWPSLQFHDKPGLEPIAYIL